MLVAGVARGSTVSDQRQAQIVLASLRGVERELAATEPGSPEAEFLQLSAARLRAEYQQFDEDVRGHGLPEPAPFPDEAERS
jgi:hypothetical protein